MPKYRFTIEKDVEDPEAAFPGEEKTYIKLEPLRFIAEVVDPKLPASRDNIQATMLLGPRSQSRNVDIEITDEIWAAIVDMWQEIKNQV